jgi:tRNA-Thr(GGU) m(6)t(6)A37 methyltransferase TsaA
MEKQMILHPIGIVKSSNDHFSIHLDGQYVPALQNIKGFSHLQIVWWGHLTNNHDRKRFIAEKLFKKGPDRMGVFATRSPQRPNPILISTISVKKIDVDKGIIYTPFLDAADETPVLDIKPYFLMERVKNCEVPAWCSHWPKWQEEAHNFPWQDEINF